MGMTTEITALPSPEIRDLNAEIKSLMGRYDVNQTKLADVLGVSQAGVSTRLRGTVPWKADELLTIAAAFGVHPAVLFGGTAPASGGPGDGARGADDETRTRNILLGMQRHRGLATVSNLRAA